MLLRPGRGRCLPFAFIPLLFTVTPAAAQYFGQQKVQYEKFDWRIMDTDRFEIHYYPAELQVTQDAARMAERWYARLTRAFQHEFDKKPLIFYADHPDFQQTNTTFEQLSEGTGGFTEALRNRVVMPFTGAYHENDHVLGHELVHVFQYDLATSASGGGLQGMMQLPLWLIEGMAEYLSLGREDAHTAMWMRDAALRGELPTIRQLGRDPRFFPYRYGQALWAYIAGRWGDRSVTEIYRFATRAGFEPALERVIGVNSEELSHDWITAIRSTYLPLLEGRQRPQDAGDRVLYDKEIGAMHLSPVVSPDGRYVAFFGRREIFTIDLYVADARTGEIVHKLTSPNRDQHVDALSFIQTAGTWSPDGQRFAFVVFAEGDNQLAIIDIRSKDIQRRYSIEGVGAVQNPTWSPDGTNIVFSGLKGGISDLYALELQNGGVRQLTDDRYADLHPAWSPDGRTLAFVTDRGETDLDRLTYGKTRIALMDASTNAVRMLDLFPAGKHINPQFTPDGTSLYFIADPQGFSDLYRIELASNQLFQVTRLATGISGITALSPAMTVASRSGRVMFSVFENSGNNVYGLEADRARGEPVDRTAPRVARAALLPPTDAQGAGLVYEYLNDPTTGLPETRQFATRDYKSKLGLDFIGPPSFGVGVSEYGTGAAGGISFFFSDMLGDQQIGAVIQANGTFKDIGGQAQYINAKNRWNWGVVGGHIPYLTGYTAWGQDGNVQVVQQYLERIYIDQAMLMTQYPFSRTRRFELFGGYTRYGFDTEVIEYFFDRSGRQVAPPEQRELPSRDALNLFEGTAALVGDNSHFAFTSPVAGQRWRMEVSPTFGSIQFSTVTADYRRYLFMQPVSLAFRALHHGRYGRDSDGFTEEGVPLLSPIFLGYEPIIRGYARESFQARECVPVDPTTSPTNACPAFDRLRGTRIAVANFELRIPLFGVPEFGLVSFPLLPLEIAPFIDAGLAWSSGDDTRIAFDRSTDDRVPVFSTGLSARMNVLGYLILEAYYAYPFQRPAKGWHWGFNLAPGW